MLVNKKLIRSILHVCSMILVHYHVSLLSRSMKIQYKFIYMRYSIFIQLTTQSLECTLKTKLLEIDVDFFVGRFFIYSVNVKKICISTICLKTKAKIHWNLCVCSVVFLLVKIIVFNTRDTYMCDYLQQSHSTLWCLQNENKNITPSA